MKTAVICIAKNEENYLQEWIDYHKKLGFDDVYVYQNDWTFSKQKDDAIYKTIEGQDCQLKAYNSFIDEYYDKYDFAAFFDVDEFLSLKCHNNVKQFLSQYLAVQAIAVHWRIFGDSGIKNVDNDYSVLNRFTHCGSNLAPNCKVILNFKQCKNKVKFSYNPHIITADLVNTSMLAIYKHIGCNKDIDGKLELAELNHYCNKTYEEALSRRYHGTCACVNGMNLNVYKDKEEFDKWFQTNNCNDTVNTTAKDFFNAGKNIHIVRNIVSLLNAYIQLAHKLTVKLEILKLAAKK